MSAQMLYVSCHDCLLTVSLDRLMHVRSELALPVATAFLLIAGLLMVSSAAPDQSFLKRQLIFSSLGALVCFCLLVLGRKRIMAVVFPFYWLSIGLLILTQLFGTEINGAKSWLFLGPLPGFQPSELAKITLILSLAKVLHENPIKHLLDYVKPAFFILIPFGLIFLEPDLGSALVIAAIGLGMLLIRGIPWKHLLLFVLLLAVGMPTVVWPQLKPHQKERLVIFLNPEADPQGSGYQVIQSRIAIGSGGIWGKGYKQGTQSQLGFIPYPYSDFIFPVLAEEGGLIAALALLLVYGMVFWRLVSMAAECMYERDLLAIVGIISLLGFQVLINIGVTLGLAPVTGITLPLISYGGTSLVSTLTVLTLAFIIHRDRFSDW